MAIDDKMIIKEKSKMISKSDLIPIIIFFISLKTMKKAIQTGNSKIFKNNNYIYA